MRKNIKKVLMYGVMVLSSVPYIEAAEYFYSYKCEPAVVLSLFHIYAIFEKSGEHNPALSYVVECVKNNRMDDIEEGTIQDMVLWMLQMLQQCSVVKERSMPNKPQPIYHDIEQFLIDCMLSSSGYGIGKQTKTICLSQLVVNSLESCEVQVFGNLTVDGQILNPCCQGSGPVGPVGPPGPTGPQGPQGSCCITSDYLFATYFSMGFVGTDGILIETGTSYLEIPADQEVIVPLEIAPSLTNGWSDSVGSNYAFIVPETGLYKISYEICLLLIAYSNRLAVAWVERNSGSASNQLLGSSVSFFSSYLSVGYNLPTLRQTFLANLNANEEIVLVVANKNIAPPFASLIIASGFDSSVAASLVITRVA